MEILRGPKAFRNPAVKEWWRWLREEWEPPEKIIILLPCTKNKPYTHQPLYRGVVERLKEKRWRDHVHILFISDLLGIVPEERAEEYPPCCYDVPPSLLEKYRDLRSKLVKLLSRVLPKLKGRRVVAFLPRAHRFLVKDALRRIPEDERPTIDFLVPYRRDEGPERIVQYLETG